MTAAAVLAPDNFRGPAEVTPITLHSVAFRAPAGDKIGLASAVAATWRSGDRIAVIDSAMAAEDKLRLMGRNLSIACQPGRTAAENADGAYD